MKLSLALIRNELKILPGEERLFYEDLSLNGVKMYTGRGEPDILYIVKEEDLKRGKKDPGLRSAIVIGSDSRALSYVDIEYLLLPESVRVDECLSRVQDIFLKYNRWEARMFEEIHGGCNLQRIMDLGSELLGNPIALFDLSMTAVCLGGQNMISKDNAIWKNVLENKTPPVETVQALKDDKVFKMVNNEKKAFRYYLSSVQTTCIHANIYQNNKRVGCIDLQDICEPLTDASCVLADYFVYFLSMASFRTILNRMDYESGIQTAKRILNGASFRKEEIQSLYAAKGWEEREPLRVYSFIHIDEENCCEYDLEMIQLKNRGYHALLFKTEESILLVVNERVAREESIEGQLSSILKHFQLCGGESYPVEHISALQRGYKQAEEAAERMKERGIPGIEKFQNIYIERYFQQKQRMEEAYIHPAIWKLGAYDKKQGTDLVGTLYVYLANPLTLESCAQSLFIHKNTLLQRIKKIKDIMGEETFTEKEINFKLLLSCQLWMNRHAM